MKSLAAFFLLVSAICTCFAQQQQLNRELRPGSAAILHGSTPPMFGILNQTGAVLQSPDGNSELALVVDSVIGSCQLQLRIPLLNRVQWASPCAKPAGTNFSCSLNFTVDGDFQLRVENTSLAYTSDIGNSQLDVVAWSSNTSGMGITSMKLLSNTSLVLQNARNATIWSTFDVPTSPSCSASATTGPMASPSPSFPPQSGAADNVKVKFSLLFSTFVVTVGVLAL